MTVTMALRWGEQGAKRVTRPFNQKNHFFKKIESETAKKAACPDILQSFTD